MTPISTQSILRHVETESIKAHELSKAVRQLFRRKSKMKSKKMGYQKSWLMVSVESCQTHDFHSWLASQMASLSDQLPNSAYKLITTYLSLIYNVTRHFTDAMEIQSFKLDDGFEITVFPSSGIVAFLSPPGNLKNSLEFFGRPCEWNWPIRSELLADGMVEDYDGASKTSEVVSQDFGTLHKKYGAGKNKTIALVDSGICLKTKELSGRVSAQFLIEPSNRHRLRRVTDEFKPANDHGTLTATLAAGSSFGVAPEANLVSFVVPPVGENRFDHFAIYVALETIETDRGLAMGQIALRDCIDVILLPLGIFPTNKIAKEFREASITPLIEKLNKNCNINLVAAIGNKASRVAFPAEDLHVHAVGYLKTDGSRHPNCGFGEDQLGEPLPNLSVIGEDLISEGRENSIKIISGSSFSASIVAGYFTLLSSKFATSKERAVKVQSAVELSSDGCGAIKILNPQLLL